MVAYCSIPTIALYRWGLVDSRGYKRRQKIPYVGDLVGGYFNPVTGDLSIPFRLMTTQDSYHYYAKFHTVASYEDLCGIFSEMEAIPFIVSNDVLTFISSYMDRCLRGRAADAASSTLILIWPVK